MKGINRVTAAATPWKVGDQTYYIAATVNSPAAWAEVCEHIKARRESPLSRLAGHLDNFNERQQEVLLRAAVEQEARVAEDPSGEEIDRFLNTLEGAAYLLWIGLRERHPEFETPGDVMELIRERSVEAQQKLDEAGGFTALKKPSGQEDSHKPATVVNGTLGQASIAS